MSNGDLLRKEKNRTLAASAVYLFVLALAASLIHAPPVVGAPMKLRTGLTIHNPSHSPSKAYPGYTLYCVQGLDRAFVLNMEGRVVHEWRIPGLSPVVKPLSNGHIAAFVANGDCTENWCQSSLREYDWEGNMVWEYAPPQGISAFTHDFQYLPNGHILLLASKWRTIPQIGRPIKDNVILEVNRKRQVVWKWSTLDHYDQLGLSKKAKEIISHKRLKPSDVFHSNSINSLPPNQYEVTDSRFKAGNILVSQRNSNIVFIIDRASGDIVWKMQDTIGQHHASMIPKPLSGAGNILLFDNGGHGGYPIRYRLNSQVLEMNPVTKETAWRYKAADNNRHGETFFSTARGSVQRLPNNNTLIVESVFGRIFEMTPEKKVVWEYVNPHYRIDQDNHYTNQIYRAYRLDFDWVDGSIDPFPW